MLVTIDAAQRACGHLGDQECSGFSFLREMSRPIQNNDADSNTTYLQQAAFIFTLMERSSKGENLPWPYEYLNKNKIEEIKLQKNKMKNETETRDIKVLTDALSLRALVMIEQCDSALNADTTGENKNELLPKMKIDMVKAHSQYIILKIF